jgi:hypothetical protein
MLKCIRLLILIQVTVLLKYMKITFSFINNLNDLPNQMWDSTPVLNSGDILTKILFV